MANRSHLYTFDRFEAGLPFKPRGLHEWNWTIPLSHLLLMSGQPRQQASLLATDHSKVAIVADRERGVTRFLTFLRALEATGAFPHQLSREASDAREFLRDRDEGKGTFLLLEPIEIFAMEGTPAEAQCAELVEKKIPKITAQVDALLAKPANKLLSKPPKWLAALRDDWTSLGLGQWTSILYYQLDT